MVSSPNHTTATALALPPRLRTAVARFEGEAVSNVLLRPPIASVWRGQLGRWLRDVAGGTDVEGSLYRWLFSTPKDAVQLPTLSGRSRATLGLTGAHVPHAFVLRVPNAIPGEPLEVTTGDPLSVEIVLVEGAITHLPTLCAGMEAVWDRPLGSRCKQPDDAHRRGRVRLTQASLAIEEVQWTLWEDGSWRLPAMVDASLYDRVASLRAPEVLAQTPAARVTLMTPFRAKHRGRWVQPSALTPSVLCAQLLRRLGGLVTCYGTHDVDDDAVSAWRNAGFAIADATTLSSSSLQWVDTFRYSGRQNRPLPAGGVTGSFELAAKPEVMRHWHRLLRQAEDVHLGKGTAFGHGSLRIDDIP